MQGYYRFVASHANHYTIQSLNPLRTSPLNLELINCRATRKENGPPCARLEGIFLLVWWLRRYTLHSKDGFWGMGSIPVVAKSILWITYLLLWGVQFSDVSTDLEKSAPRSIKQVCSSVTPSVEQLWLTSSTLMVISCLKGWRENSLKPEKKMLL